MSRVELGNDYLDEWEKQFGVAVRNKDEDDEKEVETPDEKETDDEKEHQEREAESSDHSENEPDKQESNTEDGEEKETPPLKEKTKDDEYREFIESQPNEELKERARKLVQGLKSSDGRTSALHRQLNAREALIQQMRQQQASRAQGASAPTSARPPDKDAQQTSDELPEKVRALKQKNPEAADIIDQIAKYHSDKSKREMQEILDSRLGTIEQDKEVQKKQQEWNRLEDKASKLFGEYNLKAADIVRSDDFQAWLEIKRAEEPGLYKLYESADDADTAFLVLEKYEREYREATKAAGNPDPNDNPPSHSKGDEIREKREERKASNTSLKPGRVRSPRTDTSNLSYEEEFKRMWGNKGK